MRKLWLACCLASMIHTLSAAQLIKDINAVPVDDFTGGSDLTHAVQTTGGVFFVSQDADHGVEPWVTDGTPQGTHLLKDIFPGPTSSDVEMVTAMNGVALFMANDGANGLEIWRSDGTTDGTRMVANIGPGAANGAGSVIVVGGNFPVINGVMYFGANDGTTGDELWRTDGTAAGTYRLTDGIAGSGSIQPYEFRVVGTRLYFLAADAGGEELWTSDGTVAGSKRVRDINPTTDRHIGFMRVVGTVLFFAANDGTHGSELWRADATGNAEMVADLNTSISGAPSAPYPLGIANGRFVFLAETSSGGISLRLLSIAPTASSPTVLADVAPSNTITRIAEAPGGLIIMFYNPLAHEDMPLFMTDGTPANTGFVSSELRFSMTTPAEAQVGPWLYFFGQDGFGSPSNIYRSGGTVATTTLYATIDNTIPKWYLEPLNGKLYFMNGQFNDPSHGNEIWSTDGTAAGTRMVADITPGSEGSDAHLKVVGNRLYFTLYNGHGGFNPWVMDAPVTTPTQLADLSLSTVTESSEPSLTGKSGNYAIFTADDGVHGVELWSTDGTGAGTRMLTDVPNGSGVDAGRGSIELDGIVLFAGIGSAGIELWRTDGTPAGTYMVKDIAPGASISGDPRLYDAVVSNGFAYFMAVDDSHGMELWRSDGTAAGTTLVFDAAPGAADGISEVFKATANGRVFFRGPASPSPIYATDGTAAGSELVSPGENVSSNLGFSFQGHVCLHIVVINSGGGEFWCSNGTAGDLTQLTHFLDSGMAATSNGYLINGKLVMSVTGIGGTGGGGMYSFDGLATAPVKFSDLHFNSGTLIDGGSRLAFVADVPFGDFAVTDGTAAGTHSMLTGVTLPHSQIDFSSLFAVDDSIVFRVTDPVEGPVLWKTDGTPAGTRFLFDVDPGSSNADRPPAGFLRVGDRVYFTALRDRIGNELWSFSATTPNATDDFAETAFQTSINVPVAGNDADFNSTLSAPTVEIVTQPAHGSASVGPGTITYAPATGFAGLDQFTYRVLDAQGNPSNVAYVSVTTRASTAGQPPGTAPPPATPPPSGGGSSSSGGSAGGGGGGGALGLECLVLALLFLGRLTVRLNSPPAAPPRSRSRRQTTRSASPSYSRRAWPT